MKKIIVLVTALIFLLSACGSTKEKKSISSIAKNSSINSSESIFENNKQTDNEVSVKEKKIDKLKKGNIRYTKETKTLKYPIKGSVLYGYSDKLLYFMKFGETGCKCYVSDGKKNKEVYKITNLDYGFFSGMYENDLIEGVIGGEEQENSRNGSQLLIYRINKTGGEVIYSGESQGMPKAKMVGDRLLFCTYNDKKGEGILNEYSFKTKKVNEIIRYNYKTDKDGKFIDGKVVYALDGFSKGVVFAVEIIEKDKEQRREVWYYDFEEEKLKKLPIVPEKEIDYIGGDLACVIIGDYDQNADNTGTMYLLKDDGTYDDVILPEITSGNDIYQSARISKNIIVLRTMQKFYLIDYKKSIYETITPNGMLEQGKIITQKGDKLYIYRDFKVEKEK